MKKMLFLCFLFSFILHGSLFFNINYSISGNPLSLASRADAIDVKIITSKDSDIGLEQIKDTKNANFSKKKTSTNAKTLTRAKIKGRLKIIYPRVSRILNEEGTVSLFVWVNKYGKAFKSQVDQSSGYERLDQYALKRIKQADFKPRTDQKDGKSFTIEDKIKVEIKFKLQDI